MRNFIAISLIVHLCAVTLIAKTFSHKHDYQATHFVEMTQFPITDSSRSILNKTFESARTVQSANRPAKQKIASTTATDSPKQDIASIQDSAASQYSIRPQQSQAVKKTTANEEIASTVKESGKNNTGDKKPLTPHPAKTAANVFLPMDDVAFGSESGPSFIHQILPAYPFVARKLGIEGKVLLRLTIDSTGKLQDIKIIENPGYGFASAAIDAINKSQFAPAYRNGKPIRTSALLPIRFAIR